MTGETTLFFVLHFFNLREGYKQKHNAKKVSTSSYLIFYFWESFWEGNICREMPMFLRMSIMKQCFIKNTDKTPLSNATNVVTHVHFPAG